MRILSLTAIAILFFLHSGCNNSSTVIKDPGKYITEIEEWQHNRLERLKSKEGWLNLAGLYWLEEGVNTFGSDSANDIVFPVKAPAFCGTLTLKNEVVHLEVNEDVDIQYNTTRVREMELTNDNSGNPSYLTHGDLAWYIMKRDKKLGVRLRDFKNPGIDALDHIPSYPINPDYVVEAKLVPFVEPKTITVNTPIEGYLQDYECPGELHFKLQGKKLKLLPFSSEESYFIIIGDETSGMETYGAGRFMYALPDSTGSVILDFNKAYNPPCALTPFAACPMPPKENYLPVSIEAGEKTVHLY